MTTLIIAILTATVVAVCFTIVESSIINRSRSSNTNFYYNSNMLTLHSRNNRHKLGSFASSFAFISYPSSPIIPISTTMISTSSIISKRKKLAYTSSSRLQFHENSNSYRNANKKMKSFNPNKNTIGRRSTCRKPPYPIYSTASNEQTTETSPIGKTPYTINDSICPPTDPEKLHSCIEKHCQTLDIYLTMKPIAKHTLQAFQIADDFVQNFYEGKNTNTGGVIIDSGCGTARSTILLAKKYPQYAVIGIDRSLVRLNRNIVYRYQNISSMNFEEDTQSETNSLEEMEEEDLLIKDPNVLSQSVPNVPNVLLLRAELSDFWRCYLQMKKTTSEQNDKTTNPDGSNVRNKKSTNWNVIQHHLLYPNPYPKKARLKSRWYAHPAFPLLLKLTSSISPTSTLSVKDEIENETKDQEDEAGLLVVRSNWEGYLLEFAKSVAICQNYYNEQKAPTDNDSENNNRSTRSIIDPFFHPLELDNVTVKGPYQLSSEQLKIPMTNFEKKFSDWKEPVFELRIHM